MLLSPTMLPKDPLALETFDRFEHLANDPVLETLADTGPLDLSSEVEGWLEQHRA